MRGSFAVLVMQHAFSHRAVVQTTVSQPSSVVEVPLQRLNQIQQELDYLRVRRGETSLERSIMEHSHFGYGIDDPLDRDVALGSPLYNSTIYSNSAVGCQSDLSRGI